MTSWRFIVLLGGCLTLGCGGDDSTGGNPAGGGTAGSSAGGSSGVGGVATAGSGGAATGGSGGAATGGAGATGGTGAVASGGTGGTPTGGTGGIATGGTSGGPSSASFRLTAKDRIIHAAVATPAAGLVLSQAKVTSSKPQLIHFDSKGQLQWAQEFSSLGNFYFRLEGGTRRSAGGYAFAGYANVNTGPGVVVAITATGQLDWVKGYAAFTRLDRIQETSDGGFVASGSANKKAGVVRLDAKGNPQWGATYAGPAGGPAFTTTVTSDDGTAFLGAEPANGLTLVAKLDSKGKQVFAKTIKMGSVEGYNGRMIAVPGGGVMAGLLAVTPTKQTAAVLVVGPSGNVVSAQHYPGLAFPTHIAVNPKGGYIMAGDAAGIPTSAPWWGFADAAGALTSVRTIPETSTGFGSQVQALAPRSDGTFLMASWRTDNSDWFSNIDTIDASGSSCPTNNALNVTKTALPTTIANGGGFTTLSVSASSFNVTQKAITPTYALVCGS